MTERFRRHYNEIENESEAPRRPQSAQEAYDMDMPQGSWYTMSGQPSAVRTEKAPEQSEIELARRKKHRRTKIISLSVCGVLLLAAMAAAVLSGWQINITVVPARGTQSASGSEQPARDFAVTAPEESQELPGQTEDYFEDFRDYFENYFTSSGDIDMPAAEVGTGVTLELHEPTGRYLTLQDIYERVSPAVVSVTVYREGQVYGWGTGVVFTADGYVITNTHVIQGCDGATVTFSDGDEYGTLLVGADEASDIAVLYIENVKNLPYAQFGQSDTLRVGDEVVAIGNPLGENYAGTMTNGIISGIGRTVNYNGHTMTMLQTNAALNEGNSGGALINTSGQVVGITNMKIMSSYFTTVEGIGFAIPSSVVKQVADQLIELGYVPGEPTIGIVAGSVSSAAVSMYGLPDGVYVSQVSEGSDALEKGLQVGDVIVAVNGQSVTTVSEVNAIKEGLAVGDTIVLSVYRDGKTFDMEIELVDKGQIR